MLTILLLFTLFCMTSSTLEVVHLIFRHGERCPDKIYMYPGDPYINKSFAPYGFGQLTNIGKKHAHELGLEIRSRYGSFIGEGFNSSLVDPWSSASTRAQSSLLAVLAGLYKPINHEIWNKDLLWQPVPYKYKPYYKDELFLTLLNSKEYNDEYYRSLNSKKARDIMDKFKHVTTYVKKHTGQVITDPRIALTVYVTTISEDCAGYSLPKWFAAISNELNKFATQEFELELNNRKLKRLVIGSMLRKIVNDTNAKLKNKTQFKLHLYSGHDFNVAHVLLTLGVNITHLIPNLACVALEIHRDNKDKYNVHVLYKELVDKNWTTKTIVPLESLEQKVIDIYKNETTTSIGNNCYSSYVSIFFLSVCIICVNIL